LCLTHFDPFVFIQFLKLIVSVRWNWIWITNTTNISVPARQLVERRLRRTARDLLRQQATLWPVLPLAHCRPRDAAVGLRGYARVFRSGGAGIFRREQLAGMAPSAERVSHLLADLFGWLKRNTRW
jgi:hypothetical protein